MPYEVSCPWCHARLNIADDVGEASLICPRCLRQVANPATQVTAAPPVPLPISPPDTRVQRSVPSVASETRQSVGCGYAVVLALTLLGILGTIPFAKPIGRMGQWLVPLLLLEVVLTALILYPIGRRVFGQPASALRIVGVIGLLLVLAPVAFIIIFLSVCAVCVATGGGV